MNNPDYEKLPIIRDLSQNIKKIKEISGGSSDVLVNEFVTGGIKCAMLICEGMLSISVITELVFEPITHILPKKDSRELFNHIQDNLLSKENEQLPFGRHIVCMFQHFNFVENRIFVVFMWTEKVVISNPES